MKYRFPKKLFAVSLLTLIGATVFVSTFSFAWLSAQWGNGEIHVTDDAKANTFAIEMWQNSDGKGWDTVNTVANLTAGTYKLPSIGTFGDSSFTTSADSLPLCFGVINNLVQIEENHSVYVKFTVTLQAHTENKVILNFDTPDDYAKVYKRSGDLISPKLTQDGETVANLSDTENFPFIVTDFTVTETNHRLSSNALPEGFEDIFNGEGGDGAPVVYTYSESEPEDENDTERQYVILDNPSNSAKLVYLYVRFSANPSAIQKLLHDTDVKYNMPIRLTFSVNTGVEIRATEYRDN